MAFPPELLDKYPSLKKFEDDDYKEWNDGREQALLQYIKAHTNVGTFKDNPSKLLAAIDEFATHHDFLISIGSDKRRVLSSILEEQKPDVLVELGGYVGYSAIAFAIALQHQQARSDVRVWSLEFDPRFAAIVRELVDIAGLSEVITVVTGAASDSLRAMRADGRLQHIDFLFIDHSEGGIELYESDLKLSMELGLLKTGALVVADNVVMPGAPDYRKYVRSQAGFSSRGVECLIMPGEGKDELEVTKVL